MDKKETNVMEDQETNNQVDYKALSEDLESQLKQITTQYTRLIELYNNLFNAYLTSTK